MTLYFIKAIDFTYGLFGTVTRNEYWEHFKEIFIDDIVEFLQKENATINDIKSNESIFSNFITYLTYTVGIPASEVVQVVYESVNTNSAEVYVPINSEEGNLMSLEVYEARFPIEEKDKFFEYVTEHLKTHEISLEELTVKVTEHLIKGG